MQLYHGVQSFLDFDFLGLYMIDDATLSWCSLLLWLPLLGFVHDRRFNSIMAPYTTLSWSTLLLRLSLLGFVYDKRCNSIMAPTTSTTSQWRGICWWWSSWLRLIENGDGDPISYEIEDADNDGCNTLKKQKKIIRQRCRWWLHEEDDEYTSKIQMMMVATHRRC